VLEERLSPHPLAVDVGAVQAPQIAEEKADVPQLDDAVLLGDDLVEELDRVVGVTPEAVERAKLDGLLSFCRREEQSSHARAHLSAGDLPRTEPRGR